MSETQTGDVSIPPITSNVPEGQSMMRTLPVQLCLLLAAISLTAGGCTSSEYDKNAYDFDPDRSRTRAILDAQYAKGAAEDGSLSRHHFEHGQLNGLGRDKLDRMLAADGPHARLIVHVDVAAERDVDTRPMLAAVRDYLSASGVAVSEETVVLGPSPARSAASDSIAGRNRLEAGELKAGASGSSQSDPLASGSTGLFSGQ